MSSRDGSIDRLLEALNRTPVTAVVRHTIDTLTGTDTVPIGDLAPAGSRELAIVQAATGRHDVTLDCSLAPDHLALALYSRGIHFTPQPWDALADPVETTITVSYLRPALSTDASADLRHYSVTLPAGLEHVVVHGMGSEKFVERVTSLAGDPQFAAVEAMDADRLRVTLTEAIPVRLDAVFLPDLEGDA